MTHKDAMEHQRRLIDKALSIVEAKRHDYSGGEDPFRNFRTSEVLTGVAPWRGVMVRLGDKLSRIRSIMESGEYQVRDETIEDTIADIINYACILGALIEEETHGDTEDSRGKSRRGEPSVGGGRAWDKP